MAIEQGDTLRSETLVGRDAEVERIGRFLNDACVDGSAALLSGEPGIGKTALLAAAGRAGEQRGMRVLRGDGIEFESSVSYSALNQILLPVDIALANVDEALRGALTVALGLGSGPAPPPLVVGNAALAALRWVAVDQPLLVLVDDVHWIDRASAVVLGFVARRIAGSRIGLLLASRPGLRSGSRSGAETLFTRAVSFAHHLTRLDADASAQLLSDRFPQLSITLHGRVLAEAQGNPLALLELGSTLVAGLPGLSQLSATLPLSDRLRGLYERRIAELPDPTRRWLLLAALEGSGDLRILERAGESEQWLDDLAVAERIGLVRVDDVTGHLVFDHPLIRSAVLQLSTTVERRRAHRQLGDCLSDQPERQAWHLAEATTGPDNDVSALLETAARRTFDRGDAAGAVAAMTRAAELSGRTDDRARRLTEAAYLGAIASGESSSMPGQQAGAPGATDPQIGSSLYAAAATVYALMNGDGDVDSAHRLLVRNLESGVQSSQSPDAVLGALTSLHTVSWYAARPDLWNAYDAAVARVTGQPPLYLRLLDTFHRGPLRSARGDMRELEAAIAGLADEANHRMVVLISASATDVDRLAACRPALWRVVREGRGGAANTLVAVALAFLARDAVLNGRWDEATELIAEGLANCPPSDRITSWVLDYERALMAAMRGDTYTLTTIADELSAWALPRQFRSVQLCCCHLRALDASGRADWERAYDALTTITAPGCLRDFDSPAASTGFDLVEAAVHTGRTDEAAAHVATMQEAGIGALSSRFALLVGASAALVAPDDSAVAVFEQALATPDVERWPFELARVQFAFGRWLRRNRHPVRARQHLSAAMAGFDRLGATPWAARAHAELRASGAGLERNGAASPVLTPQEREIALLAATGLTNKQIADRLVVSPRTVGAHLYRIFPKLGITSRAALRDALTGGN